MGSLQLQKQASDAANQRISNTETNVHETVKSKTRPSCCGRLEIAHRCRHEQLNCCWICRDQARGSSSAYVSHLQQKAQSPLNVTRLGLLSSCVFLPVPLDLPLMCVPSPIQPD